MATQTSPARGGGAFIVVEGLTGVGKSTLVNRLASDLDLEVCPIQVAEYKPAANLLEDDKMALEARHALFFSALCFAASPSARINACTQNSNMVPTARCQNSLNVRRISPPAKSERPRNFLWILESRM